MRRENRRKQPEDGLDTKKMLYVTGSVLALAVIVFVITFLIYGNKLKSTTQFSKLNTNTITNSALEETSKSYGKTVNEMQSQENTAIENKAQETDSTKTNSTTNKENTSSKVAVNTSTVTTKENKENADKKDNKNVENKTTTNETKQEKVKDPEFKMPVKGDIMKEFADNKLVYSSTLDVWATHNGIDIGAEKTTVVKASADGKISSIKNDPRYGLTVIIEHVNGYKTVYSNLLSTEFVVEGENVKQGQSIGTIGNTASFEISDEPHLHFELLKDNEQQDPELYLKS